MKRIKKLSIIVILLSFILMGLAKADSVQYIKIKSLGLDKSYNAFIMAINITTDNVGNLTYMENYYTVDSYDNPKLYTNTRYETVLTSNSAYFEIMRPRDKSGKVYSLIKVTVLLNKNIIFEEWVPLGGIVYKMGSSRNSSYDNNTNMTRVARGKVVITAPNFRRNDSIINKTTIDPKGSPGFDIVMAMVIISSIYIFKRKK